MSQVYEKLMSEHKHLDFDEYCGTASFAVWNSNLKCTGSYSEMACHARLGRQNNHPAYITSNIQNGYKKIEKEKRIAWIDYLINRSYWKDVFLDEDADRVDEQRCFTATCEADHRHLMHAMVCTRHLWEGNRRGFVVNFYDLVQSGLEEDLAFLCCAFFGGQERAAPRVVPSEHTPIYYQKIGKAGVKSFLKRELRTEFCSFAENQGYSNFQNYFGTSGQSFYKYLKVNFKDHLPNKKKAGGKSLNPFLAAKKDDMEESFDRKDLVIAIKGAAEKYKREELKL